MNEPEPRPVPSDLASPLLPRQDVTLGATGTSKEFERHPKIGSDVFIGAKATVLGNISVGDGATVAAAAYRATGQCSRSSIHGTAGSARGSTAVAATVTVAVSTASTVAVATVGSAGGVPPTTVVARTAASTGNATAAGAVAHGCAVEALLPQGPL